jgi:hypothetical protein
MNRIEKAIRSSLLPGLKKLAGFEAVYSRGDVSIPLTVIAQAGGDQEYATRIGDSFDSTNLIYFSPEYGYAGFSVEIADLGELFPPKLQDRLTINEQGYDVLAPEGLHPWRYEDLPATIAIRLHTRLVT